MIPRPSNFVEVRRRNVGSESSVQLEEAIRVIAVSETLEAQPGLIYSASQNMDKE